MSTTYFGKKLHLAYMIEYLCDKKMKDKFKETPYKITSKIFIFIGFIYR
jgi:hypothetical protein